MPPVYSLRGICAYELQIVVTSVGQRQLQYSVIRERKNTNVGVQVSCWVIHATQIAHLPPLSTPIKENTKWMEYKPENK
jgi:hypothetical protein